MKKLNYLSVILNWSALNLGCTNSDIFERHFMEMANPDLYYLIRDKSGNADWKAIVKMKNSQLDNAILRFRKYMINRGLYLPDRKDGKLIKEIESKLQLLVFSNEKNKSVLAT